MERLWFKAKTFGWGWTPSTWQGWIVILVYAATIAAGAFLFLRHPSTWGWIGYFSAIAVATALLIAVCFKTGEKPGWRWGDRKD
jgi:hypothetical protein